MEMQEDFLLILLPHLPEVSLYAHLYYSGCILHPKRSSRSGEGQNSRQFWKAVRATGCLLGY
ncbi:hypothetical protein DC498_00335 [Terrimonas sp.]|nr:hypothetical protein DC498_00335 [Terrimonas sp.]